MKNPWRSPQYHLKRTRHKKNVSIIQVRKSSCSPSLSPAPRRDPDSVQNSEIEDSKDGDRKSRKGHGLKEAKKARVGKARFTRSSARLMSFEKEENPEELKSKVIRFNRFVSNIRFDPKI